MRSFPQAAKVLKARALSSFVTVLLVASPLNLGSQQVAR